MYPRLKLPRRALALALLGLTGGLAVGVPLVDSRETVEETGIEARHDASRCTYQHNHDLCVVFQQTPAARALASALKPVAAPTLRSPSPWADHIAIWERFSTRSARAPPVLL